MAKTKRNTFGLQLLADIEFSANNKLIFDIVLNAGLDISFYSVTDQ